MLERKIKIIILIFNLFNPHLWVCLLILEIERKGEREMERERERERTSNWLPLIGIPLVHGMPVQLTQPASQGKNSRNFIIH